MSPSDVIDEIVASGLRRRGAVAADRPEVDDWPSPMARVKYVIWQRGRGRPGAFMDRSVLERAIRIASWRMAIAGYAIGASQRLRLRSRRISPGVARFKQPSVRRVARTCWAAASVVRHSTSVDIAWAQGAFV